MAVCLCIARPILSFGAAATCKPNTNINQKRPVSSLTGLFLWEVWNIGGNHLVTSRCGALVAQLDQSNTEITVPVETADLIRVATLSDDGRVGEWGSIPLPQP